MLSSDSLRARWPDLVRWWPSSGAPDWTRAASLDRPLLRTAHGRVEVDRLRWEPHQRPHIAPGHVARRPAAVAATSRLHAATTRSGAPAWVRIVEANGAAAEIFASDHRCAAGYGRAAGLRVPGVLGVERGRVWLDRIDWPRLSEPRPAAVEAFVASALATALHDGAVVALGPPHVDEHGYLVIEDCGILARFEADQRALLAALLHGLAEVDPDLVSTATGRLTGVPARSLLPVARRACAALTVDWTPVAFGLSVHQLGRWSEQLGSRTAAFTLLGDELLHRLDLAHAHRCDVAPLASPESVRRLLRTTGQTR
jgi:hypothetical protein